MRKQLLSVLAVILTTVTVNAQEDYCLQFDEVNEQRLRYLTTPDDVLDTKLNGATDYTIEVWVKPTSDDINNNVVIKRWDQFAITLYQDANPRFYFTHYTPTDTEVGTTFVNTLFNVINIDEWNHIVVICDSEANTLKLYANGVDVTGNKEGEAATQTALTLDASPVDSNLYIGYGGSGSYLIGDVDKVRVKNTAESIDDLQAEITDPAYVTDDNTAILYNFDEGSGLETINEADSKEATLQCFAGDCDASIIWWLDLSTTLSIAQLQQTSFKLYPNPVLDRKFTVQTMNNESVQKIEIFDILGKLVKKVDFNDQKSSVNVSVENLNAGIYIVQTKTNLGLGIKRLIIK